MTVIITQRDKKLLEKETGVPEKFFVMPDDGMEMVIEPLRSAKRSIDIYVFTLSNADILGALRDAAGRGVAVRALVDMHPSGNKEAGRAALESLKEAGVEARPSPDYFTHTHAKSYVVDGSLTLISSVNFLQDWQRTRDHGVITTEAGVTRTLAGAFEADWRGSRGDTTNVPAAPVVLSPNNSRAVIAGMIGSAKKSVLMEHEQITDPDIIAALAARSNAGVKVELVTNAAQEKNAGLLAELTAQAPGVRIGYSSKLWMHAKLLIVDGTSLLMGSVNLTGDSLDDRREVSIVVADAAAVARATQVAQADLADASPTPPDAGSRPAPPTDSPSEQGHNGGRN
jgi:phosphatidylserine/phosphatidylglycerophosphate/cardiolipin synthase-like enzyme